MLRKDRTMLLEERTTLRRDRTMLRGERATIRSACALSHSAWCSRASCAARIIVATSPRVQSEATKNSAYM